MSKFKLWRWFLGGKWYQHWYPSITGLEFERTEWTRSPETGPNEKITDTEDYDA